MGEGFANSIIGGAETLIRSAIKSINFVTGQTGWRISRDGDAEFNNAIFRGTLTTGGQPGEPRIIMTTSLPPPLDTYIVQPFGHRFAAAILFYMGAVNDDDYAYIGITETFNPFVSLYIGAVVNGVIVERKTGSGFPAGIQMDTDSFRNMFTVINTSESVGGEGSAGLFIGSGGRQDIQVNPGPLKTYRHRNAPSTPPATTTLSTFDLWDGSPEVGGFVKVYDDSDIEVVLHGGLTLLVGTGGNTIAEFGVKLLPSIGGPSTNYAVGRVPINPNNTQTQFYLSEVLPGSGPGALPAGNYNFISGIWRRAAGSATLSINADDPVTLMVKELGLA